MVSRESHFVSAAPRSSFIHENATIPTIRSFALTHADGCLAANKSMHLVGLRLKQLLLGFTMPSFLLSSQFNSFSAHMITTAPNLEPEQNPVGTLPGKFLDLWDRCIAPYHHLIHQYSTTSPACAVASLPSSFSFIKASLALIVIF